MNFCFPYRSLFTFYMREPHAHLQFSHFKVTTELTSPQHWVLILGNKCLTLVHAAFMSYIASLSCASSLKADGHEPQTKLSFQARRLNAREAACLIVLPHAYSNQLWRASESWSHLWFRWPNNKESLVLFSLKRVPKRKSDKDQADLMTVRPSVVQFNSSLPLLPKANLPTQVITLCQSDTAITDTDASFFSLAILQQQFPFSCGQGEHMKNT